MPIAIVEALEMVDVGHRHRNASLTACQTLIQRAPVRQAGQRIDESHPIRAVKDSKGYGSAARAQPRSHRMRWLQGQGYDGRDQRQCEVEIQWPSAMQPAQKRKAGGSDDDPRTPAQPKRPSDYLRGEVI